MNAVNQQIRVAAFPDALLKLFRGENAGKLMLAVH
jgi:NADPH-dependent curcumin reductase CurA